MTKEDYKNRFVEIIVDAFTHNPSVADIVKQDAKKEQRMRKLAAYSFHFGERRNANYLSKDNNGIVISYVEDMKRSLLDHLADAKLIWQVSGLRRALYLLKKEAYRKRVRPREPFYYVWFLGVDSAHRGGDCIKELKHYVFNEADRLQLPIFLETTIEKNKNVYQYFGFEVYHTHRFHDRMPPTYFMKRKPKGDSLSESA